MEFDFRQARKDLHQLNNKISQILVYAELLQMNMHGDKERERLQIIVSGALESREITARLQNSMPKPETPEV